MERRDERVEGGAKADTCPVISDGGGQMQLLKERDDG